MRPRKVFISFLGAIPYFDTRYYRRSDRADLTGPTPYVQDAIIDICLPAWQPDDQVFIFTTDDAFQNNYTNRLVKRDLVQDGKGLQSILKQKAAAGKIHHFEHIRIPNGHSEAEIWDIFQTIFERIQPGDEIYFDITYGFRSLPMLGIVLFNYARNVTGSEVKAVFYGNYEAGREEKERMVTEARRQGIAPEQLAEMDQRMVEAPILNLMGFVELQEWTAAAREFVKTGSVKSLADLTQTSHAALADNLLRFEKAITTCRGYYLFRQMDVEALKSIVSVAKNQPIEQQLKPLLQKIEEKISPFENHDSLKNGFAAVEWCLQHNMVQQGITFLQETLISHIVEKWAGRERLNELFFREIASTALMLRYAKDNRYFTGKFEKRPQKEQADILEIYNRMREYVKTKAPLQKLYAELVGEEGFRNDINHCGFREQYKTPDELRKDLENLYRQIKSIEFD